LFQEFTMQPTAAPPTHAPSFRPTAPRRQPQAPSAQEVNVGDLERWLSVLGGSALGLFGLSRRSLGGLALAAVGGSLVYRGVTGHCACYQALGISTAEEHGPATSVPAGAGVKVEESITISKPASELFRFWRNLENLGRFMSHLDSVRVEGNRSHWVACGPLGTHAEWDAEIITERPNELIGWRSLPGSEVDTAGSVHFRELPGGRGTEVRVTLKYDPPAGKVGAAAARLFGQSPQAQIREDLRRLKQFMEGEVPTTAGQPRGTPR
jgi:uncharacterized membrane protein